MSASDPTFRNYTSAQAAAYVASRVSYREALYEQIFTYHKKTGGYLDRLLDVGCGPGNATRGLAVHFQHAMGVDPGEQMITTARHHGGTTANGKEIQYAVAGAENLLDLADIKEESVDMVVAAMAAHWFDMDAFWRNVARILKPDGTVALWTKASLYCHPSTPNAALVQHYLFDLETNILAPYELPSNRMSRTLYRTLPLPWSISPPVERFPPDQFVRREWDVDGVLSDGKVFFGGTSEEKLSSLESSLKTASMVTRWGTANPEKVGTDDDCVRLTMRRVREAMGLEVGEDGIIRTGGATALLMFKKVYFGEDRWIDEYDR